MIEGNLIQKFPECSRKIYSFIRQCQIEENEERREEFWRHESKGGWPFSTPAHGWPIADCTAEGLKCVLGMNKESKKNNFLGDDMRVSDEKIFEAVSIILGYQNTEGGWATYENNRGYGWYEMLNPSEVFGDIMIDYSYVECTSAAITALKAFSEDYPLHRSIEIYNAIQVCDVLDTVKNSRTSTHFFLFYLLDAELM